MILYILFFLIFSLPSIFSIDNKVLNSLKQVTNSIENSKNEIETFKEVRLFAKSLYLTPRQLNFNNFTNYHSFSSNLEIMINGTSHQEIVYVCNINAPYLTIYTMLSTMEKLAREKNLVIGARFLFLGAESGYDSFYPIGSRNYFDNYSPIDNSLILYFNIDKPSKFLQISPLYNKRVDLDLIKNIQAMLFEKSISAIYNEKYNFFKTNVQNNSITNSPSALISNIDSSISFENNLDSWVKNLTDAVLIHHKKTTTINNNLDYNYFNLRFFFISEFNLIVLYLIILFIILIPITNPYSKLNNYLRGTISHLWIVLLFFVILYFCNVLSSYATNSIIKKQTYFNLLNEIPDTIFLFKTFFALFIAILCLGILKILNIRYSDNVYTSSSFLFLIISIIILLVFKIDLALVEILFLIFIIYIFYLKETAVKWIFRSVITFSTIFLNLLFISHILSLLNNNSSYFYNNIYLQNLVLTFLMLPLFLLSKPIYLPIIREHIPIKRQLFSFLILTTLYTYILSYKPYKPFSKKNPPLSINYYENSSIGKSDIVVRTIKPIEKLTVRLSDGIILNLTNLKNTLYFSKSAKNFFTPTITKEYPLGRQKVSVNLKFNSSVENVKLKLIANKAIGTIDCNFPIMIEDPTNSPNIATIFIGKNPPTDLTVYFVTKEQLTYKLNVMAINYGDIEVKEADQYRLNLEHRLESMLSID